jgi:hypothetical protein
MIAGSDLGRPPIEPTLAWWRRQIFRIDPRGIINFAASNIPFISEN